MSSLFTETGDHVALRIQDVDVEVAVAGKSGTTTAGKVADLTEVNLEIKGPRLGRDQPVIVPIAGKIEAVAERIDQCARINRRVDVDSRSTAEIRRDESVIVGLKRIVLEDHQLRPVRIVHDRSARFVHKVDRFDTIEDAQQRFAVCESLRVSGTNLTVPEPSA